MSVARNLIHSQKAAPSATGVGESLSSKVYGPYGYSFDWSNLKSLLGFNGQRLDSGTGFYLLGNGCRGYCSGLMRFSSPDFLSPFGAGGINSYAYCHCDPVNLQDPSGRTPVGMSTVHGKVPAKQTKSGSFKGSLAARGRSKSMGSLINRPMRGDVPEGSDFIGWHGGSASDQPFFETGLNERRSGTFAGNLLGKGYYVALDANIAAQYAWQHPDPQLYEVFVRNAARLRPGRDYTMRMRGMESPGFLRAAKMLGVMASVEPEKLEVVIRPAAYFQVEVRVAQLRANVVYPRPYEAPF